MHTLLLLLFAADFEPGPTVTGRRVDFTLQKPVDVEVAVLDARGRVVRHLAAGLVGGKKAAPPLRPGLRQSLSWDGKDDRGDDAGKGPFSFRVRAGLSVAFGRFIGDSTTTGSIAQMPYRAPVNGLTVDTDGNLIVKVQSSVGSHGNSGLWPWHVRLLDRAGKYQKTLLPYPPTTPPEKASGMRLLPTPGRFTPANLTSLYPVFYSLGNEVLPRLADGRLVFVHSEKRLLNYFSLDGSNRLTTVPMWSPKAKLVCPTWLDIQVALSPDGKTAYYANVAGVAYDGKKPGDIHADWPQGRVYRQDLTKTGSDPEPFFDLTLPDFEKTKYWMPSAWDKKTAAAHLDVDAKGNVVVCDLVNGQVVEVSPEGKRLSETKVPWPDKVVVSRKTGTLYVLSRKVSRGAVPPATLYRITGRGDRAKVTATLLLKGTVGGAATLDESGDVPVLWLGGQSSLNDADSTRLLRIEDRDGKLAIAGEGYLNEDRDAISFLGYLTVDREAELVYVTRSGGKVWCYDGSTGKGGLIPLKAVDLAIGPGGDVYTWGTSGSYDGPIGRFGRDLKSKGTFGHVYGRAGRGSSVCGIDVDQHGRTYATFGTNECHVRVYDEKGELVNYDRRVKSREPKPLDVPAAITGVSGYGGSIRVDLAGNIYLLQGGLPKGHTAPPGYEKDEAYRRASGTIYKFGPKGGEVVTRGGGVQSVKGAVAEYPGCSPVSQWNAVGACVCTKPRFDIDGYGRLYMPDGITYSVSVRDNAGNEITRFGSYGNLDSSGPSVPLGWPVAVGATDKHVYVGDCLNHRVVRVDRKHAIEKVLPIEP